MMPTGPSRYPKNKDSLSRDLCGASVTSTKPVSKCSIFLIDIACERIFQIQIANETGRGETSSGNKMENEEAIARESAATSEKHEVIAEPTFNTPPTPISHFVSRPDYPDCLLGEHVDIAGCVGVVVAIVKHSIKLRSPEGATRSFNSFGLRRIHGPPPMPSTPPLVPADCPTSSDEPAKQPASREVIEEPDFEQTIIAIADLVHRPDFPKCAFGQHVNIGGYAGVVVEIVNQSLRVRSQQGTSRNYNARVLRNLHG